MRRGPVVPAPDGEVLGVAAATADDVHHLAPLVPDRGPAPPWKAPTPAWRPTWPPGHPAPGPTYGFSAPSRPASERLAFPPWSQSAKPSTPSCWRSWRCTPKVSPPTSWSMRSAPTALGPVTGEPFAGQRRGGWGWLADGVRVDQHMGVCRRWCRRPGHHRGPPLRRRATGPHRHRDRALLAAPYEDTLVSI